MANTVSSLSYANTFGDWMVATNDLVTENNILAKDNYVKDSGTLYLSENTQTALQANGNVVVQKTFSVVGTGSSATIQNNLDVQGQGYFTNTTLSLATTGNANVGKTLEVLGSGTGLKVSNNSIFGGSIAVVGGSYTATLQANSTVNTSTASIVNTVYAKRVQANTDVITNALTAANFIFTNALEANTSVLTSTVQANSSVNTSTVSVTGTTFTDILQANSSSNTSNASVYWTLYANTVQANVATNTATAFVTGTTFTDVLQANTSANTVTLSVTGTSFTDKLQANTVANTTTLSVVGTAFTDVLQANTLSNTTTMSVVGTTFTDVLQANTLSNTTTMSVVGTTFTDVLQANTSANTQTLSVSGTSFTDKLQANTVANTTTLSVVGTTFTNVLQANTSANTTTMSVVGTTFTDKLQANTVANTTTMSVVGTTFTDKLQANTVANTTTMSVVGTTFTNILVANNRINTPNVWATDRVTANVINANNWVFSPNVVVSNSLDASAADASVKNLNIGEDLSIGGNFVINGKTVFNSNQFTLSQASPNETSYLSVFRTANGASNGVVANASVRWNETDKYWDLKDVSDGTYYRIITEQRVSDSTVTVDATRAASLTAANTLNNAIQTANTLMFTRTSAASLFANGAFAASNIVGTYANTAITNAGAASLFANGAFAAANNVAPQIAPAFTQANSAFAKANAATSEIKSLTAGSPTVSPTSASITFTSNNGVAIYGTTANTLSFSTPQDVRTSASPSFATLSLSTTPLQPASGGTGAGSLSSAFNSMVAAATGTASGTSGYVLTTGGAGNFYWAAGGSGGGGGTQPGTRITSNRLSYTGDGTTTLFDTPTFSQANQVRVYINGVRQLESEYSLNSGTSKITMSSAPVTGDKMLVEVDAYTTYAYYANNIAYGPVTGNIPASANTIQLAIDNIESGKMPKSGGTFTGDVVGLTMPTTTSNTSFATTAFVNNLANSSYTFTHSITGQSGTVVNGVYTTGSYPNPSWITSLSADKLTLGTIPSATLGNSVLYIGTSPIRLNRASAANTGSSKLTGVDIDGDAGTVGGLSVHSGVNNENNKIVRTDASGNTSIKYLITTGHDKATASPTYIMGSYSTGTSAIVTSFQTAYLSVASAASATKSTNIANGSTGALPYQTGSDATSFISPNSSGTTKYLNQTSSGVPVWTALDKNSVQLGNVDNTADSLKDVRSAGSATDATYATKLKPISGPSTYKMAYTADGARTNVGDWGRIVMVYDVNGQTYGVRVDRADYADSAGSAPANGGTSDACSGNASSASYLYMNATGGSGTYYLVGANDAGVSANRGLYNNLGVYIDRGSASMTVGGNITANSDRRLKSNIQTITNALEKTTQLRGVTYDKDGRSNIGVVAQEVREIIPEVVLEAADEDKTLSVAYGNIVGLLIESIKELKTTVDELKAEIDELKGKK